MKPTPQEIKKEKRQIIKEMILVFIAVFFIIAFIDRQVQLNYHTDNERRIILKEYDLEKRLNEASEIIQNLQYQQHYYFDPLLYKLEKRDKEMFGGYVVIPNDSVLDTIPNF